MISSKEAVSMAICTWFCSDVSSGLLESQESLENEATTVERMPFSAEILSASNRLCPEFRQI